MPFKSVAQEHWMEAHKEELEKLGVNVREWEKATKEQGKKLPERVSKSK